MHDYGADLEEIHKTILRDGKIRFPPPIRLMCGPNPINLLYLGPTFHACFKTLIVHNKTMVVKWSFWPSKHGAANTADVQTQKLYLTKVFFFCFVFVVGLSAQSVTNWCLMGYSATKRNRDSMPE